MIELDSKIKNALIKIDFIKRYEELSNKGGRYMQDAIIQIKVNMWMVILNDKEI